MAGHFALITPLSRVRANGYPPTTFASCRWSMAFCIEQLDCLTRYREDNAGDPSAGSISQYKGFFTGLWAEDTCVRGMGLQGMILRVAGNLALYPCQHEITTAVDQIQERSSVTISQHFTKGFPSRMLLTDAVGSTLTLSLCTGIKYFLLFCLCT